MRSKRPSPLTIPKIAVLANTALIEQELSCSEKLSSQMDDDNSSASTEVADTVIVKPTPHSSTTIVYLAFSNSDLFKTNEEEYRQAMEGYNLYRTNEISTLTYIKDKITRSRKQTESEITTNATVDPTPNPTKNTHRVDDITNDEKAFEGAKKIKTR